MLRQCLTLTALALGLGLAACSGSGPTDPNPPMMPMNEQRSLATAVEVDYASCMEAPCLQ